MLFCYFLSSGSSDRLLRQVHRQLQTESCGSVPWMNVSSSSAAVKEEIYYLYDLSINTTVITLDNAKARVKNSLPDRISFADKYNCCSSESYTNQDPSSSTSYSSSTSPGKLAFAISADEDDLEDTSGMPCNPDSVTSEGANKCTPIVGNVFLIAPASANNSTGDEATATFKKDILEAIQYSMDHDKFNKSPYMNVTYIGTRNTTNDGAGSSGGGWAYIPILNNAKDCFLTQVNGVITTVQNKTPGVLDTVEQQAITLGPMGIASIIIASSLLLLTLLGCWCKRCSRNRKGITDTTSTVTKTNNNKRSVVTNEIRQNNTSVVERIAEPYTPKTETSVGSTTIGTTTFRSFSIVESSSEDDIEIALANVPTTTTDALAKNQNITFPPVYDEASEMLTVALLTYAYASLRKYAAKTPGKYNGESAILRNEPVKAALVYGFVKDNIDILKTEEEFQGEDGLFALKQLLLLISNIDGTSNVNSGEVVVFNDKNPEQICYGITINRVDERIVVSFRGTQSFFDVIHDIKFSCQKVANPLYGQTKNQKRFVQNHKGFYDCLFQHKEDGKTKFQTIMDQLLSVVKENPDYKVYITGHSLGGALATLFTFFASTPQYLGNLAPYPFTCVSIASPLVGNEDWRRAFMLQEKLGKIRHLRVTNYGDVVPKVPQLSLDFFPVKYCHVGVHLQLYDNTMRFSYPMDGKSTPVDARENIIVPLTHSQTLHLHGCDTYHSRIDYAKEALQKAYLNDMYSSKEFVGSFSNV